MKSETASRERLLDGALAAIRENGYAATTVDDVCRRAKLSKGSFFHYFRSKDDLALAAIERWNNVAGELFANASYQALDDPLARIHGYLDLREAILSDSPAEFTCLLGTLVQETYASHPEIRIMCDRGFAMHIDPLVGDLELAKTRYAPRASFTAESVGYLIQAVLQGAFIFAKAQLRADPVRDALSHLHAYIDLLFHPPFTHEETP